MAEERIVIRLTLDTSGYQSGAQRARSATDDITNATTKTDRSVGKMQKGFSAVGKVAAAAFASKVIVDFAKDSVRAATNLSESMNAVEKVFGSSADRIKAFGEVSAQTVGLAQSEFQSLAVNTGALLQNFEFTAEAAAEQSIRLTQRASDMASVFNKDVDEALGAVNAALRGETEQIRAFGVSLDDATVRAKAVELGLAETTAEVDKHGKAVATLELIYEQTDSAAGDFLQTSGDLANAQRIAAATAEDAQARLGKSLQAPSAAAANLTATVLDSVTALGAFGDAEAQVAQQSLRVQEAITGIRNAAQNGDDPLTALADGLLHIAQNGELTEDIFFALATGAGLNIDQFEDFADVVLAQAEALGIDTEVMKEMEEAMRGTGETAETSADGIDEHTDALEENKTAAEEAQAALREYLDELAGAANSALKAVNSLEDLQDAHDKVAQLQKEGKADTQEYRTAQLELAAQVLETEQALQDFSGGGVEAAVDAIAQALEISSEEARELLSELGLLDGKTVNSVVDVEFKTSGSRVARQVFDSGGRISGFQSGTSIFRAEGGPVTTGQPFIVGEQGPEVFIPNTSGQIIPNHDLVVGGGGGDVQRNVVVNFIDPRLSGDPRAAVREAMAIDALTGQNV